MSSELLLLAETVDDEEAATAEDADSLDPAGNGDALGRGP